MLGLGLRTEKNFSVGVFLLSASLDRVVVGDCAGAIEEGGSAGGAPEYGDVLGLISGSWRIDSQNGYCRTPKCNVENLKAEAIHTSVTLLCHIFSYSAASFSKTGKLQRKSSHRETEKCFSLWVRLPDSDSDDECMIIDNAPPRIMFLREIAILVGTKTVLQIEISSYAKHFSHTLFPSSPSSPSFPI